MREDGGSVDSNGRSPRRQRTTGRNTTGTSPNANQQSAAAPAPVSPIRRLVQMAASMVGGSGRPAAARTINDAVGGDVLPASAAASSSAGGEGNKESPFIGDVIYELVVAGQVQQDTKFENSVPPPSLFPFQLGSSNINKYRHAMRVADTVISQDEDLNNVFRAAEPNMVAVVAAKDRLNAAVVSWVLGHEGKQANSRNNKAKVSGIGNRVIALLKENPNLFGTTQRSIVGFFLGNRGQ